MAIQTIKIWYFFFNIKGPDTNLKDLQVKYVIAPTDQISYNVPFISHRFYAQALVKGLGLQNSDASNTYCRVFESNTNVLKSNRTVLKKRFNFLLMVKSFHKRTAFQNSINILLYQELSSLHQHVMLNL